ncbi:lipid II flippase MurJ [Streptomyces ovatisporus]|uniref:Lipid II flippase MurJ n=1 Tax=Streptomyces ovatisporus TaxID=1128682 RepID=A0ABV9ACD9_9ACTN
MTDTHASRTADDAPLSGKKGGQGGAGPRGSGPGAGEPPRLGRFLARAAAITAAFTAAGAFFGLLRDQAIANLFGADADTDAFLIAWTVPELASTLLIEDAMALVLVPAFSLALSQRAASGRTEDGDPPGGPDPVWAVVTATLPRLSLGLAAAAAALAWTSPLLVRVLAPGLPDASTAVDCMRLTSLTVVTFGLAGYCSAALRAHRHFVAPAAIYVAYNAAIIAVMFAGHAALGVQAAALGVAVGGLLMVLVQLPSFIARLPGRAARRRSRTSLTPPLTAPATRNPAVSASAASTPGAGPPTGTDGATPQSGLREGAQRRVEGRVKQRVALLGFGVLAPVICFALTRQGQVLFERFLAAPLPAGAISHLNYAQKVAQMPMVLSLMVCTVTFPVVARAMADGDRERARRRVERDLALVGIVVLLGTAYVTACAPQIIQLLFQRGAFDARDTADTAAVMRVYSCGLLGHSMVGALVRPFFSGARPTWYPAAAMGAGLSVTVIAGAIAVRYWGVHGIAAANAVGITFAALLLLRGLGARVVAVDVRSVAAGIARLAAACAAAALAGWGAARLVPDPLAAALAGGVAVLVVFASVAHFVRAPEVPQLFATVKRRLAHVQ